MTTTFPAHRYGLLNDEWALLKFVAYRSDDPYDLASRLFQLDGTLDDLIQDRIVSGRFDILRHLICEDPVFGSRLFDALRAPL